MSFGNGCGGRNGDSVGSDSGGSEDDKVGGDVGGANAGRNGCRCVHGCCGGYPDGGGSAIVSTSVNRADDINMMNG